jgi:RsiW-degrading membrane proteinase PrsW (M82 family)
VNILNIISVLLGPAIAFYIASTFRKKLNSRDSSILMVCFFMAMVTVIPSLIVKYAATELGLSEKTYSLFGKIGYSIFSAFIDEINKYIIIIAYAYRKREFDEPVAGILVCIMIGLGFTTFENLWHIMDDDKYSGTWRMLTAIPMSIVVAIVLGYYAGLSKYGLDADDLSSFGLRVRGLLTAVFFHAFYNFFLFMEEYKSLTALIVIALIIVIIQIGVNLLRASRLHTRLKYSRRKRSGTSEEAIF